MAAGDIQRLMCHMKRPHPTLEPPGGDLPQRTGQGRVMTETIPSKKQIGLPPWFGAFTPIGRSTTMAKLSSAAATLSDFGSHPDVFVEGIGRIDDGGTVSHLIFYVRQIMDGRTCRTTALRVIVPTAALPLMAQQLACPDMADTEQCSDLVSDADLPLLLN
jgi:hypothetical protein